MDQRLSPPETPLLASSSSTANNPAPLATPLEPLATPQDPTGDLWTRVDRGVRIPADTRAPQDPRSQHHVPALERFPPLRTRDPLTLQSLEELDEHSAGFLVLSNQQVRAASHAVQQQGPNDHKAPSIAQLHVDFQLLIDVQAPLPAEAQLPPPAPSTLIGITAERRHRLVPQLSGPPHFTSTPSYPITHRAPTEGARSNHSLPEHSSTASPITLQQDTSRSELSGHNNEDPNVIHPPTPVSRAITPSTAGQPAQDVQPSFIVGRVELPSNNGPNASIADLANRCELDSMLSSVPEGHVRSPITGNIRKRQMMDDCPNTKRKQYKRQWDELCGKDREVRGPIEGYEEGDSELDFSDWENEKEQRRKRRKL
jgi:hypothetical protein